MIPIPTGPLSLTVDPSAAVVREKLLRKNRSYSRSMFLPVFVFIRVSIVANTSDDGTRKAVYQSWCLQRTLAPSLVLISSRNTYKAAKEQNASKIVDIVRLTGKPCKTDTTIKTTYSGILRYIREAERRTGGRQRHPATSDEYEAATSIRIVAR